MSRVFSDCFIKVLAARLDGTCDDENVVAEELADDEFPEYTGLWFEEHADIQDWNYLSSMVNVCENCEYWTTEWIIDENGDVMCPECNPGVSW